MVKNGVSKANDAEQNGGAVLGVGAAVGHPWSAVDDSTEKVSVVKQKVLVQQEASVTRADIGEKRG